MRRFLQFLNKKQSQYTNNLTMSIAYDPVDAENTLNAFIGRFLFSSVKNGVKTKKNINLNLNASANYTSAGEINLLNYLTEQLSDASCTTSILQIELYYKIVKTSTLNTTTLKADTGQEIVLWYTDIGNEEEQRVALKTELNVAMLIAMRSLFGLKALIYKGMQVLTIAGSTVNFKIGLEGMTTSDKQSIEEQVAEMKKGVFGTLGTALYMNSDSTLELVNINSDHLIRMQDSLDKSIATISGIPLSFINGENLHQLGGEGGVELLVYDDFLSNIFDRYIYPVLSFVDASATRVLNEYIIEMKINNLITILQGLSDQQTSLCTNYGEFGKVPRDLMKPIEDGMKLTLEKINALMVA